MSSQFRKFKVIKKVKESALVSSLYLKPDKGYEVENYFPGQHMLFKLKPNGYDHFIQRFYSFSDAPGHPYYRISVKKELAPKSVPEASEGICSSFLHESVSVGQVIEAKGPMGVFCLDVKENHPVVLIGGGIGVTPLLSMLNTIVASKSKREVWFFFGVRNSEDHIFKQHLEVMSNMNDNIHVFTFYQDPLQMDEFGRDYHFHGFVDLEFIFQNIPANIKDFYICGPTGMMEYITTGLKSKNISEAGIHTESFGPASLAYQEIDSKEILDGRAQVSFRQSGKLVEWDTKYNSIVELAEANNVEIDVGCLFGDCGTCMTDIIDGEVEYNHKTMIVPDPGTCLPCSCRPKGAITLDA